MFSLFLTAHWEISQNWHIKWRYEMAAWKLAGLYNAELCVCVSVCLCWRVLISKKVNQVIFYNDFFKLLGKELLLHFPVLANRKGKLFNNRCSSNLAWLFHLISFKVRCYGYNLLIYVTKQPYITTKSLCWENLALSLRIFGKKAESMLIHFKMIYF